MDLKAVGRWQVTQDPEKKSEDWTCFDCSRTLLHAEVVGFEPNPQFMSKKSTQNSCAVVFRCLCGGELWCHCRRDVGKMYQGEIEEMANPP